MTCGFRQDLNIFWGGKPARFWHLNAKKNIDANNFFEVILSLHTHTHKHTQVQVYPPPTHIQIQLHLQRCHSIRLSRSQAVAKLGVTSFSVVALVGVT